MGSLKCIPHLACLAIGGASAGRALLLTSIPLMQLSAQTRWEVSAEKDAMTDRVTVAAILPSTTPAGFSLGLVCSRGDSSISLRVSGPAAPSLATDGVEGEVRLDSGGVMQVVFVRVGERAISLFEFKGEDVLQTTFFSPKIPPPFIGRLARAHLLRVRYDLADGTEGPTIFFRLPSNSRPMLDRILRSCGQSLPQAERTGANAQTRADKWRSYDTWTSCVLAQPTGEESTVAEACRQSFPPDFGWCIDVYLAERPALLSKRDALVAADAYMEDHGGSPGVLECRLGS